MTVGGSRRSTCRLGDSMKVTRGETRAAPLSENYTTDRKAETNAPQFPVDICMCADCGHGQQLDVIDSKN
jgi:hypothetical protein